jgi:hypothetical protein
LCGDDEHHERHYRHREIASFIIKQLTKRGKRMVQGKLTGITPGQAGSFAANPIDKNGNPIAVPAGVVPAWESSDPVNAPVVASVDGLSATVQTTAAYIGCTLTVSAALPDGTNPTSGAVPVPVLVIELAAFVITQTA